MATDQYTQDLNTKYDYLRNKALGTISGQASQGSDAIARKFASMGNLNSGAAIKSQQNLDQSVAAQQADALQGIGQQQADEARQHQDVLQQQQFAAGEALKGREFTGAQNTQQQQFAAQQNLLGQQFQAGESGKQREFAGGQSELERAFQGAQHGLDLSQQKDIFNQDLAYKKGLQADANNQFAQNFGLQLAQYNSDQATTNANLALALADLDKNPGDLAQFTGEANSLLGNQKYKPDTSSLKKNKNYGPQYR